MIVVHGRAGAEVTAPAEEVPPIASTPLVPAGAGTETVGAKVIVDGTAVTMPGFWSTQWAQIPVK